MSLRILQFGFDLAQVVAQRPEKKYQADPQHDFNQHQVHTRRSLQKEQTMANGKGSLPAAGALI